MDQYEFSVVIVDYKSAVKTSEYAKYISSVASEPINIVIVDNSADVNNTELLLDKLSIDSKWIPWEAVEIAKGETERGGLYLINPHENLGYAKGNNLGVLFSTYELKSKYSVISNNDIKILEKNLNLNVFRELFCNDSRIAVIGPRIIGNCGENQSPCRKKSIWSRWIFMCIIFPYQNIVRRPTSSDLIKNAKEGFVYRIQGSFFVVDNEYFIRVDGFDPNTFLYAEEVILSERLKKINAKVYFLNRINVLHEHSKTISNHFNALERMKMRFESEMYYYEKYLNVPLYQLKITRYLFEWYVKKYSKKYL